MSVFDASTTGQNAANDQAALTTEDWIAKVAEEKGEHWKDPQTLAKGYIHAQKRIKELEALEEDARKNDYAKQLLEELKQQKASAIPSEAAPVQNQGNQAQENTTPNPADIESLITKALSDREKQNTVAQNIALADQKLTEAYGTEAAKVLNQRAQELGMSLDRLKELAGESPTAFLRLVGEANPKETNRGFNATVNTSTGFERNAERNSAYYMKLRRENKSKFYDPKTQNQMLADMARLGSNF
jgi:hypothetical protein